MNNLLNFDVYHPNCPSRLFFDNMADKWVLFILDTLKIQPEYFNALKNKIIGISPKVLSQKLKMLERDGFIERKILDSKPIKVEYSLTKLGLELADTAFQFKIWAQSHMQYVLESQQRYDAAQEKV